MVSRVVIGLRIFEVVSVRDGGREFETGLYTAFWSRIFTHYVTSIYSKHRPEWFTKLVETLPDSTGYSILKTQSLSVITKCVLVTEDNDIHCYDARVLVNSSPRRIRIHI